MGLGDRFCISVPNYIKIGQTIAKIKDLTVFRMEAVGHVGFLKFKFLTVWMVKGSCAQKSVKPLLIYRDFCDFQDGGRRHLGYSKIRNVNCLSSVGGHRAKFRQNLSNGCGDMAI